MYLLKLQEMNVSQRLRILVAIILTCLSMVGHCHAEATTPTLVIHARRYKFDPQEITLVEGKKVKLTLISDDVSHGIAVDELGISTVFSKTHPAVMVITPTVAGTFEGVCSRYCGAGHNRMRLIIHVTAGQ